MTRFKKLPIYFKNFLINKTFEEIQNYFDFPTKNKLPLPWYMVNTNEFMTEEGIQYFKEKNCELRAQGAVLALTPGRLAKTHTDWPACSIFFNILGEIEIGYVTSDGIKKHDPEQILEYEQPDGQIVKKKKIMNCEYEGDLPVIEKSIFVQDDVFILNTEELHYGIVGKSNYLFFSPRTLDINLTIDEVYSRLLDSVA